MKRDPAALGMGTPKRRTSTLGSRAYIILLSALKIDLSAMSLAHDMSGEINT